MNLPPIRPITWAESTPTQEDHKKRIVDAAFIKAHKPEPEDFDQPPVNEFQKYPLKHATGKLKDLEDTFIRLTQQRRKHRVDYTSIISLFDKYKRVYPTEEQLTALELMLKP